MGIHLLKVDNNDNRTRIIRPADFEHLFAYWEGRGLVSKETQQQISQRLNTC